MRRLVSAVGAFALALGLAACGGPTPLEREADAIASAAREAGATVEVIMYERGNDAEPLMTDGVRDAAMILVSGDACSRDECLVALTEVRGGDDAARAVADNAARLETGGAEGDPRPHPLVTSRGAFVLRVLHGVDAGVVTVIEDAFGGQVAVP